MKKKVRVIACALTASALLTGMWVNAGTKTVSGMVNNAGCSGTASCSRTTAYCITSYNAGGTVYVAQRVGWYDDLKGNLHTYSQSMKYTTFASGGGIRYDYTFPTSGISQPAYAEGDHRVVAGNGSWEQKNNRVYY